MGRIERLEAGIMDILVVDDDEKIRNMSKRILERAGYCVSSAQDGVDALESLRLRIPDLVIINGIMPRIAGDELLSRMKADPRLVQVAVLGDSGDPDICDQLQRLGANAVIHRPWHPDQYLEAVSRALGRTQATT